MLTVACVLFGGGEAVAPTSRGIYSPEWVNRLYRGVRRNLRHPFTFACYTDIPGDYAPGVELRPLVWPRRDYVSLLEPFRDECERLVLLGLDTIICGPIDDVVTFPGRLGLCHNPDSTPNSGIIVAKHYPEVAMLADLGGADRWAGGERPTDLTILSRLPHYYLDDIYPGIYSWSHHRPLPEDARIVYCCGDRKPHMHPDDPLVSEHWR